MPIYRLSIIFFDIIAHPYAPDVLVMVIRVSKLSLKPRNTESVIFSRLSFCLLCSDEKLKMPVFKYSCLRLSMERVVRYSNK